MHTKIIVATTLLLAALTPSQASLWQFSASIDAVTCAEIHDHPRAYLWIPPKCKRVRAVVVAQHNLLEESILLNPQFRETLSKLDIAEVWVVPNFDFIFDFNKGAGDSFEAVMKAVADVSGYDELATAPVVPMGHSAAASYPWNFAAWAPNRTLAVLSIHGDMPETNLTGSGRPNPNWGDRNIDGVPGLFAMGQFEWWDKRTQPGLDYVDKHPNTPLAMLPDIGHGHFDSSDAQADFLGLFLRKAVQYRLAASGLKPIDPKTGWLVDRWDPKTGRRYPATPYKQYQGDRATAFWCFDREMALATEGYGNGRRLDESRSIVYVQHGKVLAPQGGAAGQMPRPKLDLDPDGITCHFAAYSVAGSTPAGTLWNSDTARSVDAKPLEPRVLCGPLARVGDDAFRLQFDQSGFNSAYRSYNIFLSAMTPTSDRAIVHSQPAGIFVAHNSDGAENTITFPPIADVADTRCVIKLAATASSGLPVSYYVDSGPAMVEGNKLTFTAIPPRTKYPVTVRVVAWQWGRAFSPQVRSSEPVSQTFVITK